MLAADVSQGDFQMASSCMVNSIVAAAAKNPATWCRRYLFSILNVGFNIYKDIVNKDFHGDLQTDLELEAVTKLNLLTIDTRVVEIEIDFWPFSGNLLTPRQDDEESRLCASLEQALERMFGIYERGLVLLDKMWLSVARIGNDSTTTAYYLFNSHGVDESGNFGLGTVARAFYSEKLSTIAATAARTATKDWDGEFAVHGMKVTVRHD